MDIQRFSQLLKQHLHGFFSEASTDPLRVLTDLSWLLENAAAGCPAAPAPTLFALRDSLYDRLLLHLPLTLPEFEKFFAVLDKALHNPCNKMASLKRWWVNGAPPNWLVGETTAADYKREPPGRQKERRDRLTELQAMLSVRRDWRDANLKRFEPDLPLLQSRALNRIIARTNCSAADAREIAQQAWQLVMERLHTFDPGRGKPWTFVKTWVEIAIRRHWGGSAPGGHADDEENEPWDRVRIWERRDEVYDVIERYDLYRRCLRLLVSPKLAPQEQMAFLLVKLGPQKPSDLIESPTIKLSLTMLLQRIEENFRCDGRLPAAEVEREFEALRRQMRQTIRSRVPDWRDRPQLKRRGGDVKVGDTRLHDFFKAKAEKEKSREIVIWWSEALRKIKGGLRGGGGEKSDEDGEP